MSRSESGFAPLFVVILIALAIAGGGAVLYNQKSAPPPAPVRETAESDTSQANPLISGERTEQQTQTATKSPPTEPGEISQEASAGEGQKTITTTASSKPNLLNQTFNRGKCYGSGPSVYTAAPMRPADIALIVPLGLMVGGHVTPVDHQYFYPKGWRKGAAEVPIFAPADGTIVSVTRYASGNNIEGLASGDGYDIVIEHSCTFYSKLGLLTGLSDGVAKKLGPVERGREKHTSIPVKAGEEIARVGRQSMDFFTFDINTPPKQWIVPAHYNDSEGTKRYITDAFLYFTEPLASELLAKNPRTVEPRGGRFDYDKDGRLVGTWFLKGSGGYIANDPTVQGYWKGHLVFAYNEIDPSSIEISAGSWAGTTEGSQFAVKNNAPDPKDVSVASGMIKYALTYASFTTLDGRGWNQEEYVGPVRRVPSRDNAGVILVQMVSDRLIKVEKFPGKTEDEVTGFSPAAEMYER